jgi:hypothetical protein
MALKDELEALIREERQRLELRDQEHTEYHQRQKERFDPLRRVLYELGESTEPALVKVQISDGSAVVELGDTRRVSFNAHTRFKIEPNFEIQFTAGSIFRERPGFRIETTNYFEYAENTEDQESEHTDVLADDIVAGEYVTRKIAEHVAQVRHVAEVVARQKPKQS